jgi:membrane associated rhomboid family serine protease
MAFFQDPRPSREPFLNAPATIFWLIGALVAAHVLRVMLPAPWPADLLEEFAFIPARYSAAALSTSGIPAPGFVEQVVPFISYMFLHGDYVHLSVNSLFLLAFGPIVAKRLKTARFLLFFLLCGLAAAVTHLIVYFGAFEQVVGASGGVAGLMGAAIRIFYGRLIYGRSMPQGETPPLAPVFSRPILGFTLVWLIANFVAGVTGLGLSDATASIAWVAHLGGYFAGLFAITLFDRFSYRAESARPA